MKVLAISLLLLLGVGVAHAQKVAPYKISAIRAMLFYDGTGTFSPDVLSTPDFALWNTVIGEGSAEGPSTSTLVVVELSGAAGAYAPERKLQLTATTKGGGSNRRQLLKRTVETGIISENGKLFLAFWLYDTGCEPIELNATLTGQKTSESMKKTIEFHCGE